jgi:hypothetical protein
MASVSSWVIFEFRLLFGLEPLSREFLDFLLLLGPRRSFWQRPNGDIESASELDFRRRLRAEFVLLDFFIWLRLSRVVALSSPLDMRLLVLPCCCPLDIKFRALLDMDHWELPHELLLAFKLSASFTLTSSRSISKSRDRQLDWKHSLRLFMFLLM